MIEIYYIEDDENIARIVKEYMERREFTVKIFPTIEKARAAFLLHVPELALVDWNMPDGRGDLLLNWIRSKWKELPVIFLTVRDDTRDIVSAFQNGGDDYVVKPFELDVLYSRICALLRRTGNVSKQYLSCGPVSLDKNRMMVFSRDKEVKLSQAEYQLLLLLLENKGNTITRERLLEQIWDANGNYVNDNTLTVTMKRLREKLNQPACLKTIRSFGYRMEDSL